MAQLVKNLPANAGDIGDEDSFPELERSTGGGHGNPLQDLCLENPWQVTVHWVTKNQTQLKQLSMHARVSIG